MLDSDLNSKPKIYKVNLQMDFLIPDLQNIVYKYVHWMNMADVCEQMQMCSYSIFKDGYEWAHFFIGTIIIQKDSDEYKKLDKIHGCYSGEYMRGSYRDLVCGGKLYGCYWDGTVCRKKYFLVALEKMTKEEYYSRNRTP